MLLLGFGIVMFGVIDLVLAWVVVLAVWLWCRFLMYSRVFGLALIVGFDVDFTKCLAN